jgi:Helix-turn-helix domain
MRGDKEKESEEVIIDGDELSNLIREEIRIALTELFETGLKPAIIQILKDNKIESESMEQVTTQEACRRWGKSRTTIIKCCNEGLLKSSGKKGRQFLFTVSDLTKVFGNPSTL